MGLQTTADAGATALETDDAAFPRNLLNQTPPPLQPTPSGEVLSIGKGAFDVQISGSSYKARRAVSCLLEPEPGDVVALVSTQEGVFITDVLVRSDTAGAGARVSVCGEDGTPQDVVLSAGSLKIEAGQSFEAEAKTMLFRFEKLLMTGRQLALVGEKLLTSMKDLVTTAKKQLASFETTSTRARNRVDRVDETDQLRAGTIQTKADSVALTQAGSSLTVAKEDIRLDGKRISMG